MKKLSRRISCAFCEAITEDAAVGDYVEIQITVPEATGEQRQLLGAHSSCLSGAMRDGYDVEVDLLM